MFGPNRWTKFSDVPDGLSNTIMIAESREEDSSVWIELLRSGQSYEVLIVGGEDHKSGQEDDAPERYSRLEKWRRERFPMAETIVFRWSGQVMESVDGVAFIGRNPGDAQNVYIVTGDSGQGKWPKGLPTRPGLSPWSLRCRRCGAP